ncbi:hypothetical protein KSS93_17930 [Pseudomonas xanthosomatis]|uniref:hypothetical protein n=1 Tax=Pseudomonas xanthosomatis TaxID=2842356 RepID=UPI001C3C211D|nr:hypothetical protein [Pseudomonas xanthosomatis]QXH44759.1 hypothetical protein KSS93_17930 [Pseudomonas xanthosomatis]
MSETAEAKPVTETPANIDGAAYVFATTEDGTFLKQTCQTTPSTEQAPKPCPVPRAWVVTRKRGVPLFAVRPKADEDPFKIMSADALYAKAVQWFEPLADNYRELIWMNPDASAPTSTAGKAFKHLTWQQVIDFAIVDRPSLSFASYMPGDWKRNSEGGAGFLMVMIEGKPFWTDGVGQIPFAVDTFRMYYEEQRGQNKDEAIKRTIQTGMDYGDGNPFNPTSDPTNEYDNYMVLRGADWASQNFKAVITQRIIPGRVVVKVEQVTTQYTPLSDIRLRNPADAAAVANYGVWKK